MTRIDSRWLTLVLLLVTATYAIAEDITLTTYYPSPRGVYAQLRVGTGTAAVPADLYVMHNAVAGLAVRVDDGANPDATPFVVTQTGNVGVGTAAPGTKLQVNGSGTGADIARVRISSSNDQAGVSFMSNGGGEVVAYSPTGTDEMRLFVNGADRLTVQTTGNVSIPATLTATLLDCTAAAGCINTTEIIDGQVGTNDLALNAVTIPKIAADAVTTPKIANDAVTSAKILNGQVLNADLGNDSVTWNKIADGNVFTADIGNGQVTSAKLTNTGVGAGTYGTAPFWLPSRITVGFDGRITGITQTAFICQAFPRENHEAYAGCPGGMFGLLQWCSGDCSGDDGKVTICCNNF